MLRIEYMTYLDTCPKPSKRKISDFRSESVTECIPAGFREPCRGKIGTSIQFQRILSEVRFEYHDLCARFSPILKIRNRARSSCCTKSLHKQTESHVACGYVVRTKMTIYSISATQERGSVRSWTCLTQISSDLHNSEGSWSKLLHKIVTLKKHFWSSKSVGCVWEWLKSTTMQYPTNKGIIRKPVLYSKFTICNLE